MLLGLGGKLEMVSSIVFPGAWTSVCITFNQERGVWATYINGLFEETGQLPHGNGDTFTILMEKFVYHA